MNDENPTDEIMKRWLNPHQTKALNEYCSGSDVSEADKRTLAQLTGRGYRPPTTVEGWREMHEFLKRVME